MDDIIQKENLLVRMQEDIRRALEKPEGECARSGDRGDPGAFDRFRSKPVE